MNDTTKSNEAPLSTARYDDLIAAARDVQLTPRGIDDVWQRAEARRASQPSPWRSRLARLGMGTAIIGLLLMCAVGAFSTPRYTVQAHLYWIILPTLLPTALLAYAWRRVEGADIVQELWVRGILWSNMIVGTIAANTSDDPRARACGLLVTLGCVLATAALGRRGLDRPGPDDEFRPVAHHGRLAAALIMACADAQTLFFAGMAQVSQHLPYIGDGDLRFEDATATIAALTMAGIVWGLSRMRTWALIGNVVANLAIAGLALHGYLGVPVTVAGFLALTAACQLLLPVPVWAAALGDRARESRVTIKYAPETAIAICGALCISASVYGPASWFAYGMSAWQASWQPVTRRRSGLTHMLTTPSVEWTPDDLTSGRWAGREIDRLRVVDRRIEGIRLERARITEADFRHSSLAGSSFRGGHFPSITFVRADIRQSDFDDAKLDNAIFARADARAASFAMADLRGADFHLANLQGADLRGANLEDARLAGTDLKGVRWGATRCPDGTLSDDHPDETCVEHLGALEADEHLVAVSEQRWFAMEGHDRWLTRVRRAFLAPYSAWGTHFFALEVVEHHGQRWLSMVRPWDVQPMVRVGPRRYRSHQSGVVIEVELDARGLITVVTPDPATQTGHRFSRYSGFATRYEVVPASAVPHRP